MPVLPIQIRLPDAQELGHELSQGLTKGLLEAQEAVLHARQAIFRREVDHTVPETIAVVLTIFISMGLVMYWGIVKGGDCTWGRKK